MSSFDPGPTLQSASSLIDQALAEAPADSGASSNQVFDSQPDIFTRSVAQEQTETPPVDVPAPLSAPPPAPVAPQPDWQSELSQIRAQQAAERQQMFQLLQQFAPKQTPVPEAEPDYMAMLPPDMRHESNLPTAKVMYELAKKQADGVRQEMAKQQEAAQFNYQVQQAHQSAAALVQRVGQKGFDFSVQGGDKAAQALDTVSKAFAARWGGDPGQYENQILEIADSLARARIGHQVRQNQQRQQLQAPAGRVPPMSGAPGAAPSQLPNGQGQKVPTEAEARSQGFASLTDWYVKNR